MSHLHIKALAFFVKGGIAQKNTQFGTKFKFMFVVRSKMRPTSTIKDFEHRII
jgi:hypothetical protein